MLLGKIESNVILLDGLADSAGAILARFHPEGRIVKASPPSAVFALERLVVLAANGQVPTASIA